MTPLEEIARIIDPEPWDNAYWHRAGKPAALWAEQARAQNEPLATARTIIDALMEPTDEHIDAAYKAVPHLPRKMVPWLEPDRTKFRKAHQAMLQSILDENPRKDFPVDELRLSQTKCGEADD